MDLKVKHRAGLVCTLLCLVASTYANDLLRIPMKPSWTEVEIPTAAGWVVRFRCSHDDHELICRVYDLRHGAEERYPEILLDPTNLRTPGWRRGQWWLHSSYNLCQRNGEFNVYERAGKFQCSKNKPGWRSNHFPLHEGEPMEIRISLHTFGIVPGRRFGLALDVTDTHTNWRFWPQTASMKSPATWGQAELVH